MRDEKSTLQNNSPELLSTKLSPPRLHPTLVPREGLLRRLDEGLQHQLTLLSAPAGFGKTTLVRKWMAALQASQAEDRQRITVAWLSLDRGDNDPIRFWRYVVAALRRFDAEIGTTALNMFRAPQSPPFETFLTSLINDLVSLPTRHVLVLEDYHVINTAQIHEALTFLIDYLPTTLHLIIISREDPPLPLARLRANQYLYELNSEDLRFSSAETAAFLQEALSCPLSSDLTTQLERRTEGWPAGLRLMTLALQGRHTQQAISQFLGTFTGGHQHILRYLAEEVLTLQPKPVQDFLLKTAFLNRLTGSLCDAVTDRDDSVFLLARLEEANLFIAPLDGAQQWYRYHGLFAEAMHHYARRQLGQQALNGLYEKASGWYKANGLLPEAVEMALAAEAFTTAAGLIEEIIDIYSIYHEITTMRRWLEQLPQGILYRYPLLCFGYAVAVLFKSDRSAPTTTTLIDGPLQQAEQQWRASQNWVRLGQLLAFRAMVAMWQGDRTANASLAAQALELLPESELMWRGSSLLSLSVEKLYAGRLEDAQAMAQEAYTLCDTARNYYAARAGMLILAKIKRHQGLLSETNLISQQILASSGEDLLDRGHALINLAELAYEQNRLAEAERWVSEALEIVHQYGEALGQYMIDESLLIPATVLLACLEYLRGKQESAQQRLNQLLLMTRQRGWLHRTREILAWQARLALRAGDLAAVERWAVNPERRDARIPLIQQETEEFVVARLLIVQCKAGEALLLLAPWQQNARDQKRGASELEILVLTALAHFSQDRQSQAKRYLKQALSLAKEQGYQRLFLDEGEPMAALLKLVLSELTEPGLIAFVSSLLSSFGSVQPVEQISAASALIERLSQQEERVLRLLAAGLSNPEIAGELIVSVNTVKTQVKSIYRKLDVHNRDEAGETARRLNLL